jgi:hypothetical protein
MSDIYTVEKILRKRFNATKNYTEYYLKWEGYPSSQNSWEPAENITADVIQEFEEKEAKRLERLKTQELTIDTSRPSSPTNSTHSSSSKRGRKSIELSPPIRKSIGGRRRGAMTTSPGAAGGDGPSFMNSSGTSSSCQGSPDKQSNCSQLSEGFLTTSSSKKKQKAELSTPRSLTMALHSPNVSSMRNSLTNGSSTRQSIGSSSTSITFVEEEATEFRYEVDEEYNNPTATDAQLKAARNIYQGLEINNIEGVTRLGSKGLFFHVSWKNDPQDDLVPSKFANVFWPQEVIKYYERHMELVVLKRENRF